jgi:hypothetical protein
MFATFAMWLKFFYKKKQSKQKDEEPLALSSFKWHWHNCVKTHQLVGHKLLRTIESSHSNNLISDKLLKNNGKPPILTI